MSSGVNLSSALKALPYQMSAQVGKALTSTPAAYWERM